MKEDLTKLNLADLFSLKEHLRKEVKRVNDLQGETESDALTDELIKMADLLHIVKFEIDRRL